MQIKKNITETNHMQMILIIDFEWKRIKLTYDIDYETDYSSN